MALREGRSAGKTSDGEGVLFLAGCSSVEPFFVVETPGLGETWLI